MKKWIFAAFSVLMIVIVSSCKKDDLGTVTGYNSVIDVNAIALKELRSPAKVTGYLTREYIMLTDTSIIPVTSRYVDSFEVIGDGHTQNFHFNTPSNATKCNIMVDIWISGGIKASSATIGSIAYKRDKSSLFVTDNLTLMETGTSSFSTGVYTVDLK